MGSITNEAKLDVKGYTNLGDDAPKIKMKKLTGTTAITEGGTISIIHGLDTEKILSVTALVEYDAINHLYVPSSYSHTPNFAFNYFVPATQITINNRAGNSSGILGKLVKVLITYEE